MTNEKWKMIYGKWLCYVLEPKRYVPNLLIFPLRDTTRRPRSTRRFHLFFQSCQVSLNQLAQRRQRLFKLLRRRRILIHLRLGRPRRGSSLRADDVTDALSD